MGIEFHMELMEYQQRAIQVLVDNDVDYYGNLLNVGIDHSRYGLDVTGIKTKEEAAEIVRILRGEFTDLPLSYIGNNGIHWGAYIFRHNDDVESGFESSVI